MVNILTLLVLLICIEFSEILENTVRFRILENILEKKECFFKLLEKGDFLTLLFGYKVAKLAALRDRMLRNARQLRRHLH